MILDIDALDSKTQRILSQFEMLVIGRYESKTTKIINISDYEQNDDEMAFDDDLHKESNSFEMQALRVRVCKLIALSPCEFNIYHYNY